MLVICPTLTAETTDEYEEQMSKIANFAERIHVDLSDGIFAPTHLLKPTDTWWPIGIKADFHLMYRHPQNVLDEVLKHHPNLIIVHAESEGNIDAIIKQCRARNVRLGIALLPDTPSKSISPVLDLIDHVLIFSGKLGYHGGQANLLLLNKVRNLKKHKPSLEIGWDGGVNDQVASQLVTAGVDVLNVGGYLYSASEPQDAYQRLQRIADETGTT